MKNTQMIPRIRKLMLMSIMLPMAFSVKADTIPTPKALFSIPDINTGAGNAQARAFAATAASGNVNVPQGDNISIFDFDASDNMYYIDPRLPADYGLLFKKRAGQTAVDTIDLRPFIQKSLGSLQTPKGNFQHNLGAITIDSRNRIYIIYYVYAPGGIGAKKWQGRAPVLLYSGDGAKSFSVYKLPGNPDLAFMETRMTPAAFNSTPLIGTTNATSEKKKNFFAYNNLYIIEPQVTTSGLSLSTPVLLSDHSPGTSNHTGGYSSIATKGQYSYIAFNQVNKDEVNNDLYLTVFNRSTNKVEKTVSLGTVFPKIPDPHVTPVAVLDKQNRLHIISGSQGFPYSHYIYKVNNGAVTKLKTLSLPGHRVYASVVADNSDNLLLAYSDYDPLPCLYTQKFNGATQKWDDPVKIAAPPASHKARTKDNFGIYYFRLGIDHEGEPYLSYTFWNTYETGLYPRTMIYMNKQARNWNLYK